MSTTKTKTSLITAERHAAAFKAAFPPACYERWQVAGSIRRRRPGIGDVEHVVIPAITSKPDIEGMFGQTIESNALWDYLDAMVDNGDASKHVYGKSNKNQSKIIDGVLVPPNPTYRWGPIYRGVDYAGMTHEIFLATPETWGSILLIRTGPAWFSQYVMACLKRNTMYRHRAGGLVLVEKCPKCDGSGSAQDAKDDIGGDCPGCKSDGEITIKKIPTPDERTIMDLAGIKTTDAADPMEPWQRDTFMEKQREKC